MGRRLRPRDQLRGNGRPGAGGHAPERVVRLALLCTSPGGEGGSYPLHELEDLSDAEVASVRRRLLDTRFDDAWLAGHPTTGAWSR